MILASSVASIAEIRAAYIRSNFPGDSSISIFAFAHILKWSVAKNMASSSEAFERFFKWKNSKSPLRVIEIVEGLPSRESFARIYEADPDAGLVGIVGTKMHSFRNFDVSDSDFEVSDSKVVATRRTADWLVFEEASE